MTGLTPWLDRLPLIAILRGVRPGEAVPIGEALLEAGFAIIEVPLYSPDPFTSIGHLTKALGARALIGAGTVLDPDDVGRVAEAGGSLIVAPNGNEAVVRAAKARGLLAVPGFLTPGEGLRMAAAGADGLKLFPAEAAPPPVLKALRAVFPPDLPILPVGSITPEALAPYWRAGARGFGLGSALYKPGDRPAAVAAKAATFRAAMETVARLS